MQLRSLAAGLLLAVVVSLSAALPGHAQRPYSHAIFNQFITALNRGDTATASSYLSPDFTMTFADGRSWTGPNAMQALLSLGTPVTVVSVAPTGGGELDCVLSFGSGAPMAVTIRGSNGVFISMTVTGPAS